MRKWISFPKREGIHSRQAHADLPAEGMYEREIGRNGFFGPATHMHHRHAPTGWVEWEGDLRPRSFDLNELKRNTKSPWSAPLVLQNASCKMRLWQCEKNMKKLVRNADGDDLIFVHDGAGEFFCDYGHMHVEKGDYVLIPRNTLWRIEPSESMFLLMIEATNDFYQLPEKGMVGNHAVFDPTVLDVPELNQQFKDQQSEDPWKVQVKHHGQVSTIAYPYNPLDAVGWHGDLSVVRLNVRDIRPMMSHRYHLPPSAHTTFVAQRFVVCTFAPRPIESDPGALKVPFYHSNDDFDEVLFYHEGDFFSRDNIDRGMMTFHPSGFPHGPHPKAFKAGLEHKKKFTDEYAVMVDTRDPLQFTDAARDVENPDYVYSWREEK